MRLFDKSGCCPIEKPPDFIKRCSLIKPKEDAMKKRMKMKAFYVIAPIVLAALILSGCAAPTPTAVTAPPQEAATLVPPTAPASTEAVATAPPAAEMPETEAPPVEEPSTVMGNTAVIVIPQDPLGFNGLVADTGYEAMVGELVFLAVSEIDPEGNVYPELAAEIPTLENGGVVLDEENWTMDVTWKLRDDVSWADGEQVTADDVIFTWNAITDPDMGIWVDGVDYTDSVEKVDDFTFIVHYNTVYPAYQTQFGGENFNVYPEHYCDATQGFTSWDCNREPLSDGPFMLEEWVTGDHLSFVRNPNYFESGKPSIDNVIVQIVPEQAVRKTMMIEGDADMNMWLAEVEAKELQEYDNIYVSFSPSERWVFRLIPNLAARGTIDPVATPHPVLADVKVRKAIREAIDVDKIINSVFLGLPKPVWTEFFRPPYNVCDIPRPAYDPEAAKALLEEAGWTDTDADGVRECHGCLHAEEGDLMEIELMTYGEYGEELELAHQLVGEMLQAIGFKINLSVVEGAVMWADYASGGLEQTGDFDLNMYDDGYQGLDPTDNQLWYYYHSDAAEPDSGWNVGRWLNPDFDALLDEAYTLDEDYRKEVFCQIGNLLDDELPEILLWSAIGADAFSTRLEGGQSTTNDLPTWNVADWKIVQ
jgi:peptide/nickel transport system substrate-binding protein